MTHPSDGQRVSSPGNRAHLGEHLGTAESKTADQVAQSMSLAMALAPVVVLMVMLVSAVLYFGDNSIGGPVQVVLMVAAMLAGGVGVLHGVGWKELERGAAKALSQAATPIFILLAIGGLIGVWLAAGIIPTLIHYGAGLLNPDWFYLACLGICAVVAVVVGSSWTTAGTVGIALIGLAGAAGLSLPATAGAIISGAYFGDKLSPLSDTTNLAAGLTGTDLFVHVRYLLWTTLPAFIGAGILFTAFSLFTRTEVASDALAELTRALADKFYLGWVLLIPFALLFFGAMRRLPPVLLILAAIVVGAVFGMFTQPLQAGGLGDTIGWYLSVTANGFAADTGVAAADDLLSRGGMSSMLTTVWLIIAAMFFSGMMERSGCLTRLLMAILGLFQRKGAILYGVGATSLATNVVASEQYLSLVLSSRMYAGEVEARGLKPETLSRTVEDFGTVTSPLIPWNTCGAYMAGTLGVATWAYLPFCFFNLLSPVISTFYIATGRTLRWHEAAPAEGDVAPSAEPVKA